MPATPVGAHPAAHRATRLAAPAYALVLAAAVAGPLLGPGYLLLRDAVSTPRSFLTPSALGLGGTAARAVPQDAVVAAASSVVDGGLLVRAVLVAALWLAGWGAARLASAVLPGLGVGPRLVAATVAVWNPYVAERLLQGHWSLLLGYGALPWIAVAAHQVSGWRGWAVLGGWLAVAGLTPTGAVLGAVVAAVAARRWAVAPLAVGACLPWLAAAAVGGGGARADPAGVAAFAARAEPHLGTLGSLAGLGGIWNADAVPASRAGPLALLGTAVLVGLVAVGAVLVVRCRAPLARPLLVLAAAAVLLPALAATGPGVAVGEWASGAVPGAGLLRDGQKWVAWALPGYALCAAAAAQWLGRRVPGASAYCCVVLVAVLPDLAWGVGGALRPVTYPPGWVVVREEVRAAPGRGDVAVLPAGMFRVFGFSGPAPVLDPAPRWLPAQVLATGDLPTGGAVVAGEGDRARRVEDALLAGKPAAELARLGVGWVLVERRTPGDVGESAQTVRTLERVHADADLELYRVPGAAIVGPPRRAVTVVALAHLVWAGMLLAGVGAALVRRRGR